MKILNFKSVIFVKISKYKIAMQNNKKAIFAKGYVPNWSEKETDKLDDIVNKLVNKYNNMYLSRSCS